jgi:hypothetical protein
MPILRLGMAELRKLVGHKDILQIADQDNKEVP